MIMQAQNVQPTGPVAWTILAVEWTICNNFNGTYTKCLNTILLIGGQLRSHYANIFLLQIVTRDISQLIFCSITKEHRNVVQQLIPNSVAFDLVLFLT